MSPMNLISLVLFLIFLAIIGFLIFFPKGDFSIPKEKINCRQEERNLQSCPETLSPVCGYSEKNKQTFSNKCFACKNSSIIYWEEGACK